MPAGEEKTVPDRVLPANVGGGEADGLFQSCTLPC